MITLEKIVNTLKDWNVEEVYLIGSAVSFYRETGTIPRPEPNSETKDIDIFVKIPNLKISVEWEKEQTRKGEKIKVGRFKRKEMQKFFDDLKPFIFSGVDFFIKDKSSRIWQSLIVGGFRLNPINITNYERLYPKQSKKKKSTTNKLIWG